MLVAADQDQQVSTDPVDFDDAIAFFRQLVPMTDDQWDALTAEAREQAFTVAGVANVDVVSMVWDACTKAIADGTDLDDFKAAVGAALDGAWKGSVDDPGWRIETIFRTNTQRAYSAGRYREATQDDARDDRPFWLFDAIDDGRLCDDCSDAKGTILPCDSAWWQENYSPLHHNCRCQVITLTDEQAQKMGGVTPAPPDVDVDDGFGRPEGGIAGAWRPDPNDYPAALRAHLPPPAPPRPPTAPVPPSAAAPPGKRGQMPLFPPASSAPAAPAPARKRAPKAPKAPPPPPPPPQGPGAPQPGPPPSPRKGLQLGKHVKKVSGPRKYAEHAQRALDSIQDPKIQALLERHPIGELAVVKSAGRNVNGHWMRWRTTGTTKISLTSDRSPASYGSPLVPGKSWSVSSAAPTADEAVLWTFVHELGHHLHMGAGAEPQTSSIIRHAFNASSSITRYGGKDRTEYFAECWSAYNFEPQALQAHDPGGFRMVEDVLRCLGVLQ